MRVEFEYAVIGYNEDLTDPHSASEPIALVVKFQLPDNAGCVALASRDNFLEELNITDPVTRSVFKNYGTHLHDLIDIWVQGGAEGGLIEWIQNQVGGTASVIKTGNGVKEIAKAVKISNKLAELYSKELPADSSAMPYMCMEPIPMSTAGSHANP